jgi:elongation factor Ts
MAEITAGLVKELREKTGAGMMDCKRALTETKGDMEGAVDWLRKKGLAAAAKKAGRVAADGLIGVVSQGSKGAMVEVNAETDFVARNENFQDFVRRTAEIALAHEGDMSRIQQSEYPGGGSVTDKLTHLVATIGENMSLRRATSLSVGKGAVASYVHNATGPGLGKIGVLVALESTGDPEKVAALGKQLAMHIAAANPLALTADDLDPALVERERAIAQEKANESGKPANIVEKMVEGSMAKFRKEHSLVSQLFVMDNKTPVADVVAQAAKEAGAPIKLAAYIRFQLGEGIEKKQEDFAAEVAAAVGQKKDEPVA